MESLEILSNMSKEGNEKIKLSPLSNIISANSGKDGWGRVIIAMPNEIIENLAIDVNHYVGGLLIAEREEFEKCKLKYNLANRKEEELDLDSMIDETVKKWIEKNNIKPSCYKVIGGHEVKLKEEGD